MAHEFCGLFQSFLLSDGEESVSCCAKCTISATHAPTSSHMCFARTVRASQQHTQLDLLLASNHCLALLLLAGISHCSTPSTSRQLPLPCMQAHKSERLSAHMHALRMEGGLLGLST